MAKTYLNKNNSEKFSKVTRFKSHDLYSPWVIQSSDYLVKTGCKTNKTGYNGTTECQGCQKILNK